MRWLKKRRKNVGVINPIKNKALMIRVEKEKKQFIHLEYVQAVRTVLADWGSVKISSFLSDAGVDNYGADNSCKTEFRSTGLLHRVLDNW